VIVGRAIWVEAATPDGFCPVLLLWNKKGKGKEKRKGPQARQYLGGKDEQGSHKLSHFALAKRKKRGRGFVAGSSGEGHAAAAEEGGKRLPPS